jgi:hypothetical protein
MGNTTDKQEYTLVNNPINCETDVIPESTVIPEITSKSLQTLITDIARSNNINYIFKNYDEKTILDYYKSDSIIGILSSNNDKALQLANALPVNKEKLIFKYFSVVPVNLIIIMSKNIDFNVLDENEETFLFKKLKKGTMFTSDFDVLVKNHLKYITKLLNNVDNINVNLENKNKQTFLENLIYEGRLEDYDTSANLIQSLEKQNYNFNRLNNDKQTFLTRMLICNPDMTFELAKTMNIKSFDIAIESRWLYYILTNHLNYIYYMFQKEDYIESFYKLYNNLFIEVWDDKFIIFIRKALLINTDKCIECLNYKNKKGNTIIHLIASYHDKKTLQFIVNKFQKTLKIEPNNDGKTPLMLYNESSFKTILK